LKLYIRSINGNNKQSDIKKSKNILKVSKLISNIEPDKRKKIRKECSKSNEILDNKENFLDKNVLNNIMNKTSETNILAQVKTSNDTGFQQWDIDVSDEFPSDFSNMISWKGDPHKSDIPMFKLTYEEWGPERA